MKHFNEEQLKQLWQAVKHGKKKFELAEMFNVTQEEVSIMYSRAHKLFTRGSFTHVALKQKTEVRFERPKAIYDNPSHEDVLLKYGV